MFQLLFYSPFFLLKTTLSLPVECWREAVLPGLGSGSCREIDKQSLCQSRAFCSAGLTECGLAHPESPVSHWGSGKGLWGSGIPAPQDFPHPQWVSLATQSGLCCTQLAWEFGGSLLGSPRTWALSAVCCVLASVAGTSHSALPWQAALKWKGGLFVFPFLLDVPFASTQGGASRPGMAGPGQAGQGAPRPGKAHGSPEHPLLSGLASRGPRSHRFPALRLPPSFLPVQASPRSSRF